MIGDFLRRLLNISSPSKVELERLGIFTSAFSEGLQNGLNGNVQSTEERIDAWIHIEDISRAVFLLDRFNYEECPDGECRNE